MKLQSYQSIQNGQLTHSGHSYQDLATTYGTPLYIFDQASFIARIKAYQEAFVSNDFQTQVLFASKSLLTKAIGKLVADLGIGQDVVSAGEMYLGLTAGVDPANMYFHGNNKGNDELQFAMENQLGTLVIDNRSEAKRASQIAQDLGRKQRAILRLNPGVDAHTHEYIQTATLDSKFGESIFDPNIMEIIQDLAQAPGLDFVGFHCHIGSQIFDHSSFLKAASEMMAFAAKVMTSLNINIKEINFGGGFGVYYTEEDQPFDVPQFLPSFVSHVEKENKELGLGLEKITIEPGRSLVNDSGSTLYRVGDIKETMGGKHYLFIDGGMADNIRPALYQAKYEAMIVNKADQKATRTYTIAGKACESGDKIIEAIDLPQAQTGDLLLVNGTGAYNYTMASHYNRLPIPAMIHIDQDHHRLTVKRESFQDLCRQELD